MAQPPNSSLALGHATNQYHNTICYYIYMLVSTPQDNKARIESYARKLAVLSDVKGGIALGANLNQQWSCDWFLLVFLVMVASLPLWRVERGKPLDF